MSKFIDLTGQKFGRLTVIVRKENHITHSGQIKTRWLCKCDCGNECIVNGAELKRNNTLSCGCLRKEKMTKHGKTRTRIYKIWSGIIDRCLRENNKRYKDYGGRGITVCAEWLHDFQAFYDWAITHGYTDNLTLDRIDNEKGYSPDNCRWADRKTQSNNRRDNRIITYNGKSQSLMKWSNETGIAYHTLRYRLNKGLSFEEAIKKEGD